MIKVIGIPYDANSSFMRGSTRAPAMIREMDRCGSANRYTERGLEIIPGSTYKDLGDLDCAHLDPKSAFKMIQSAISRELDSGARVISLGGDHSISFPVIEAHAQRYSNLNILHIDAHADLYDDFEGNPYSHASPFARLMETGLINSLTQVGIRTLTTHQKDQINRFGVYCQEMRYFDPDIVTGLKGPLYISLDIDVLDPAFAPGISHHEPGGMSVRQLIDMLHLVDAKVIGADLVELNPQRDVNNMTAMVAYKLLKELTELIMKS